MDKQQDKIAVYGFGKIGQALAAHLLKGAAVVHAIDRDQQLINAVNEGVFNTAEPGVGEVLHKSHSDGRFTMSADAVSVMDCKTIIICLPLSINDAKLPDAAPFIDALVAIAPCLSERTMLVVETSVPVGFCRTRILPALEIAGRIHGRDYFLVHSPELIKSGTMLEQLSSVPKILGGVSDEATEAALTLYESFFKAAGVTGVDSIEAAEMVKMAGMMYRDINIALANQLAVFAGVAGINLPALTDLINSDGEAGLLQPGIGVGGHCTPVYPYFMMDSFANNGMQFTLAREARLINEKMPAYAASLIDVHEGDVVLILGLAFRAGVREDAYSPAYGLSAILREKGCSVLLHDPVYSAEEITSKGFLPGDLYESGASVLVLVTMHQEYKSLDYQRLYESGVREILDGRNRMDRDAILQSGIMYKGIGR